MSNKSNNVLMTKTKVVFTVNDFDVNQKTVFSSNDFRIGCNVWQIIIDTNYRVKVCSESMFAIKLKSKSEKCLSVRFDSFIYDSNMDSNHYHFPKKLHNIYPDKFYYHALMTSQAFKTLNNTIFPNQTLSIGVIICVESKDVYQCIHTIISHRKTFNVKQFNDLHIVCGDKEFFVSKAILTSHSDVFEKMFENQMTEQKSNQLIIEDIDEEVFEEFIRFIYFGNSDKLEELKEDLLIAANKYQVLELKKICENFIFVEICDLNAIQLLLTFDKYNCNQMLENSIEFISKNLMEIKNNTPNEWKELKERHIELLARITEKMAELIKKGLIGDKAVDESIKCFTFSYIK